MAKTYATRVSTKASNAYTFTSIEAYQQAVSGQDIHAVDAQGTEVFIPYHALCGISVKITDDESDAPEDAYCAEV